MEVLGTVLGTAIQGQIVGKVDTPCISDPPFLNTNNSSVVLEEVNITHDTGSLSDTVWTLMENFMFSLQCSQVRSIHLKLAKVEKHCGKGLAEAWFGFLKSRMS